MRRTSCRQSFCQNAFLHVLVLYFTLRILLRMPPSSANFPTRTEKNKGNDENVTIRFKPSALAYFDLNDGVPRDTNTLLIKRTLFVHTYSAESNKRVSSFPAKDTRNERVEYLYHSQPDSSVLFLVDHRSLQTFLNRLTRNQTWDLPPKMDTSVYYIRQAALGPLIRWWDAKDRVEYFVQSVRVELPFHYRNVDTLPIARCNGDWSLNYAFFSGAIYTYHLLQLNLLKAYDHIVNVDFQDIRYLKPIPIRFFEAEDCVAFHTELHDVKCEAGVAQGIRKFFDDSASQMLTSYEFNGDSVLRFLENWPEQRVIYGNFLFFRTTVLRDPRVKALADFFYERYPRGYFEERWGDQGATFAFLALYFDETNPAESEKLCDYTFLRNEYFQHDDEFKVDNPF